MPYDLLGCNKGIIACYGCLQDKNACDGIGNWIDYAVKSLNQYLSTSCYPQYEAIEEYSTDGGVLSYDSWRYSYDAMPHLISAVYVTEQKASLQHSRYSAIPQLHNSTIAQFSNVYDHLDRRVQKITPEATHSFFYDGWMLVKEVIAKTNGTTTIVEFHWGNDLSGSRGGAAGVGGLLYISITHSSTRQIYVPWYDNNGNIMGYWDERGMVASSFDYSAFGETTAYGNNPDAFPIRFSTKYHDTESDLYYYTKRFYIPSLHRWLTRDPIEEDGGVNLYAMCYNGT